MKKKKKNEIGLVLVFKELKSWFHAGKENRESVR